MKRLFLALIALGAIPLPAGGADGVDIVIYGGTPAGIAAAISAAREDCSVVIVEPYRRVGGLLTNGLSHTDFHSFEGLNGAFLEHAKRVERYYIEKYGPGSPQAEGNFRGTHAEPHVNQIVLDAWLAEYPQIRILHGHRLKDVEREGARIVAVTAVGDEAVVVAGEMFIDASYEGDLMAAAGVPYRVGREAMAEYGEPLAPENADGEVQGYNFRLVMTRDQEIRLPVFKPDGYRREDFLDLLPLLGKPSVTSVFCDRAGGIYKAHLPALPNGKHDVNDVSRTTVRLSLPEINDAWPDGDEETRRKIFDEHIRHNVGLLYFLQNDAAVPAAFRDEAAEWGFCRDEFAATRHIPEQLYVREGRRMVGERVYTENDTAYAPGDARAVLHRDSIAMGEYSHNCHGTGHKGPRFGGKHTGEMYKAVPPYQIPYGTLIPKTDDCENLLVPVASSSSHVGFCALRLEPIWMSMGQAAGYAAAQAIAGDKSVQAVDVQAIQRKLHQVGGATLYVADVLPGHEDYAAVQWWGTLGGFHGLHPAPAKLGQRGAHLQGQYFEAYPGHEAGLSKKLDPGLAEAWLELARQHGLPVAMAGVKTRRDFIRQAFDLAGRKP